MLCCKFNSSHKIIGLELMFDVMAFMLQLKQAAGSDGFAVVPNTVQTCQRAFDKPMVLTLAEYPYTIIQVNDLWENLTGYTSAEVVGKLSCSVLQSNASDQASIKTLMQEVHLKRPASSMLTNKSKNGEIFTSFQVVYPLSTDSRTTYYLGLTLYSHPGQLTDPSGQLPQSVSYTTSDDANQPRFKNSHADCPPAT
jgi:PAS domain S-box-containing protein